MPLAPPPSSQIDTPASPLAHSILDDNISHPELKIEPRSPPQTSNDNVDLNVNVPNVPVNMPKTRVYARKPLPPPRQKEGMHKAFNMALKMLSSTFINMIAKLRLIECICTYVHCTYVHCTVHGYVLV